MNTAKATPALREMFSMVVMPITGQTRHFLFTTDSLEKVKLAVKQIEQEFVNSGVLKRDYFKIKITPDYREIENEHEIQGPFSGDMIINIPERGVSSKEIKDIIKKSSDYVNNFDYAEYSKSLHI